MGFFKKRTSKLLVYSPCKGTFIPLEGIHDEVFSKGLVGDGFGVKPEEGTIVSPVEGTVAMIFPTKHAIGLKCVDGMECIIHVGVDTVNLKGEGFEILVEEGTVVKAGVPLMKVDFDTIRSKDYHDDVIVVIQNAKSLTVSSNLDKIGTQDVIAYCK